MKIGRKRDRQKLDRKAEAKRDRQTDRFRQAERKKTVQRQKIYIYILGEIWEKEINILNVYKNDLMDWFFFCFVLFLLL